MDCPACGHDQNKTPRTRRWADSDERTHECLACGYRFQSIAMHVSNKKLLECAAIVTRLGLVGKQDGGESDVLKKLDQITTDLAAIKRRLA